jgi:predicted porin
MKKSLIALAALAATASFAQSSVTISGALDAGLKVTELANGAKPTQMGSGTHGASRLRFVGVEDLGGGMKANFWLEMQPNFETGAVGAELFNRGAWTGLSGNFGEIRLGRMGTNSVSAVCDIDQMGCYSGFSGGGILFSGQGAAGAEKSALLAANPTRGGASQAASTSAATGTVDSTRYMRAVRYSLPTLVTGLGINVTHAYGSVESATASAGGNSQGIDANYTNGPLKLTAAYQKAGADAGSTNTGTLTTVGAIYNLGFASIGAGVQTEKASGTALTFTKSDAYALTALFPMGATTPYVKYGERKYSGGSLGDVTTAKVTNVGVRYALSKRTYLYGDYVNNGATVTGTAQKSMTSAGLVHNF